MKSQNSINKNSKANTNKIIFNFVTKSSLEEKLDKYKIKSGEVDYLKNKIYSPMGWNNSIYSFNVNNIKLLIYKDKIVNYLFKSYFNLTRKIAEIKKLRFNPKRFSSNKLFLGQAEIKHTNTSVYITLFIFNKNKNFMKYKLTKLQKKWYKLRKIQWDIIRNKNRNIFIFNVKKFKSNLYRQILLLLNLLKDRINNTRNINNTLVEKNKLVNWLIANIKSKKISIFNYKLNNNLNRRLDYWKINNFNVYKKILKYSKPINYITIKSFKIYKFLYYYQMLVFNKNKFTNWFLNYRGFGIINLISKIYKKKVEFNIVSLKSMHLNSDIYSEAIALKLRNRKNKLLRVLKKALFKIKLPRLFDLYTNSNINNNITRKKDILNSLKYKLVSGVRFEASGRLTRRLIASRAVFKFRYVGSLKNIYSSFIGLSSEMLRGYLKSNLQHTLINSKTRNGAFGLKGWTSSY